MQNYTSVLDKRLTARALDVVFLLSPLLPSDQSGGVPTKIRQRITSITGSRPYLDLKPTLLSASGKAIGFPQHDHLVWAAHSRQHAQWPPFSLHKFTVAEHLYKSRVHASVVTQTRCGVVLFLISCSCTHFHACGRYCCHRMTPISCYVSRCPPLCRAHLCLSVFLVYPIARFVLSSMWQEV
jgi:hypothetical protein